MAVNDVPNIQHTQAGALSGEYEYDYGSYGDLLEKQLAAITAQAKLEEEERKETGLFGTRNMGAVNIGLAGRAILEGVRESYIMEQMNQMGEEAKFISAETYKKMDAVERRHYKQAADGQWFKGDWSYNKGPENILKKWGNALIGWQQGIHKIDEAEVTNISDASKIIKKDVDNSLDAGDGDPDESIITTTDQNGEDIVDTGGIVDAGGDVEGIDLTVNQSDGGVFAPAMNNEFVDVAEEDLGDVPADKAWDGVNVGAGAANYTGNKGIVETDPVDAAVAAIAEKKRLAELEKTMLEKTKQEKIDTGELNIYGREMEKNPSADTFLDWNEQAELRRKGEGGSMTSEEWDEAGFSEEVSYDDGYADTDPTDYNESSEEVSYDDTAVSVEPKMSSDLWESMNETEQADWRNKMKSELGILKSSSKMEAANEEPKNGLFTGLDSLNKLKESILSRIVGKKPEIPAFKKNQKMNLYQQMRASGIDKTW